MKTLLFFAEDIKKDQYLAVAGLPSLLNRRVAGVVAGAINYPISFFI
jgi:hypothetical protein